MRVSGSAIREISRICATAVRDRIVEFIPLKNKHVALTSLDKSRLEHLSRGAPRD